MGWSSKFTSAIAGGTVRPIYIIESIDVPTFSFGPGWAISSTGGVSGPAYIATKNRKIQGTYSGTEVRPRNWTSRLGSWSIVLIGYAHLADKITKGQICRMRIGFPGWSADEYQSVALGQIWNVTQPSESEFRIEFRSLQAALNSRIATEQNKIKLFGSARSDFAAISAGGYTPASGTISVNLTGGNVIEKQEDGGSALLGLVEVQGNSSNFFATITGISGGTLTVGTAGVYGTTDNGAAPGNTVGLYFFIDDHPIDIARRVLVSTGSATSSTAGTNGDYDYLPETWGYALPDELIDHEDCDRYKAISSVSGNDDYEFYTQAVDNGWSYLEGILAPSGFFLTERQGQITVRAAVDPNDTAIAAEASIDNDDIVSIEQHDIFDKTISIDYSAVFFYAIDESGSSDSTIGEAGTLPCQYLTQVFVPGIESNASNIVTGISDRTGNWWTRNPESIRIKCRGWRLAALAPGDIVTLSTDLVIGRVRNGRDGFDNQRCWVAGVYPDWFGATTTLLLKALPDWDGGYSDL